MLSVVLLALLILKRDCIHQKRWNLKLPSGQRAVGFPDVFEHLESKNEEHRASALHAVQSVVQSELDWLSAVFIQLR